MHFCTRFTSIYAKFTPKFHTNAAEVHTLILRTTRYLAYSQQVDLIWEDMEYPYAWTQFLSTATGLPPPSWESFIQQTDRSPALETALRRERDANRQAFDEAWGQERWMLHEGVALMETHLSVAQIPKIFNNWKSTAGRSAERRVEEEKARFAAIPNIAALTQGGQGSAAAAQQQWQEAMTHSGAVRAEMGGANTASAGVTAPTSTSNSIETSSTNTVTASTQQLPQQQQQQQPSQAARFSNFGDEEVFEQMRQLVRQSRVEDAHAAAVSIAHRHQNDPYFLLEYGCIQYFRGLYADAFEYCSKASILVPEVSYRRLRTTFTCFIMVFVFDSRLKLLN